MVLSVHKINRSIRSFGHKTARGARHFGHKAEKDFNHAGRVLKREGPKIRRGLHDTLATVHQVAGVGSSLLGSIGQATGSKQVMAAGAALGWCANRREVGKPIVRVRCVSQKEPEEYHREGQQNSPTCRKECAIRITK